jgi:hypothetical protein
MEAIEDILFIKEVENVRENGDKEPETANCIIPCGLHYFSQEGCSAYESEKQVKTTFERFRRISGSNNIQDVQYINISKDKNPLPIHVPYSSHKVA